MARKYNIVLTYMPDSWQGREGDKTYVHQCEGWIARWSEGDSGITAWAPTRKCAYNKVYRFIRGLR